MFSEEEGSLDTDTARKLEAEMGLSGVPNRGVAIDVNGLGI